MYTCTTGTVDQVYIVDALLADDSLLDPTRYHIIIVLSLCGALLSLIC